MKTNMCQTTKKKNEVICNRNRLRSKNNTTTHKLQNFQVKQSKTQKIQKKYKKNYLQHVISIYSDPCQNQ